MTRPGLRLLAFLLGALALRASEVRRPVAAVRINGREYIRIEDVATRLKADLRWIEAGRQAELTFDSHRLELSSGGRFSGLLARADGLEVYLGDPALSRSGELYLSRIDLEQRLVPLTHWGWGGEPPRAPKVIAIDPGHGGWDPGFENARLRMAEKTYTLDVGLRLRRLLEAGGYAVVMTRTEDRAVAATKEPDLQARAATAVAAGADLFVSIHFNSDSPNQGPNGTEVYTFPPQHQSSTEYSTQHRDDSEPNSKFPDAAPVTREDHWSVMFAHAMHRELLSRLHTADRGEKLRHLGVLRALNCPGVLVESAFLSNDAEAHRIADPGFRQQIAEAMAAGVQDYARELDTLRPKAYENAPRPPAASAAASSPALAQPLQKPTRPSAP